MLIRSVTVGLLGLLLTACGSVRDTRVDPDAEDSVTGTGLQSMDIRTMASRMAADIKEWGVLAPSSDGKLTSFFIYEMVNESSDTINKMLVLTKLRTELFKAFRGRIDILDRSPSATDLSNAEQRMKQRGEVTGANNKKAFGSDFVLKGSMMSRDRQADSLKSSYILVTFELTDLATQKLVWTNDYEMKTESERSVINR